MVDGTSPVTERATLMVHFCCIARAVYARVTRKMHRIRLQPYISARNPGRAIVFRFATMSSPNCGLTHVHFMSPPLLRWQFERLGQFAQRCHQLRAQLEGAPLNYQESLPIGVVNSQVRHFGELPVVADPKSAERHDAYVLGQKSQFLLQPGPSKSGLPPSSGGQPRHGDSPLPWRAIAQFQFGRCA